MLNSTKKIYPKVECYSCQDCVLCQNQSKHINKKLGLSCAKLSRSCNWYAGLAYLGLTTRLSIVQLGPRSKPKDLAKSRTLKSLSTPTNHHQTKTFQPKNFWAPPPISEKSNGKSVPCKSVLQLLM